MGSSLGEDWSKGQTPKNAETACCHSNESSVYKDRELGWNPSQVNDSHNTRTSNAYSPQDELSPFSENESNCKRVSRTINDFLIVFFFFFLNCLSNASNHIYSHMLSTD